MQHPILRTFARLEKFVQRVWYTPLVSILAAIDLFVVVVPTDALLISNAALRPKRWLSIAIWVSAGSAFGSLLLAWAVGRYGDAGLAWLGIGLSDSGSWATASDWIRRYQGPALAVFAAGPFPLQPAVVLGALAKVPLDAVFFWVILGRGTKYLFFAWAATHAPKLLSKIWGVRQEVETLEDARREQQKIA